MVTVSAAEHINAVIAKAKQRVRGAARTVARDRQKDHTQAMVAASLGVLANRLRHGRIAQAAFVNQGVGALRDGYHHAFNAGATDSMDDLGVDEGDPDVVDAAQAGSDLEGWGILVGLIGAAAMADHLGRMQQRADAQQPYLQGLADDVVTGNLDTLSDRLDTYGNSASTVYEWGYGSVASSQGQVPRWNASSDGVVCDWCAEEDGKTYGSTDDIEIWPGDGDFGQDVGCIAGPNCRCSLDWSESEGGDTQAGIDGKDVEAMLSPDFAKRRWFSGMDLVKSITAAGIAVRTGDTGRVLLLQRRLDDGSQGGNWELPGGKLDGEETPWGECARREWQEEVGLPLPDGKVVDEWEQGVYQGFVYRIAREGMLDLMSRTPVHDEVVAWFDPQKMPRICPACATSLRTVTTRGTP